MDKNYLLVPAAIIVAGALVAVSVFLINRKEENPQTGAGATASNVRPVDSTDHILGNPNAPIKVIEYSDTECPFCKTYQGILQQLMAEYGKDGKVAWVYRHFPIAQLHSKAPKEAEAAECVAELGGNDAFWKFIDRMYEVTPSNNGLDLAVLPEIAAYAGVDKTAFSQCLDSGRHEDAVQKSFNEGVAAGVRGTPHTFIEVAGTHLTLEGAQPLGALRSAIDVILEELSRGASPSSVQ